MSWSLKIALVATMFVTAVAPAQDAFVPHQLLVRLDPAIPDVDQRQVVVEVGDLGYIEKGTQTTIVVPEHAYLLHVTQPAWRDKAE